jgi:Protein of unknown function (DUF2946)
MRKLSWLMLCVMLLGALAPTVSRARAWGQGQAVTWTEVCTTAGTRHIPINAPSDDTPQPGVVQVDHCAFCVLATDRMVPPSDPFAWQAMPQAPPVQVAADFTFTPFALHWATQPRAPPACV